MVPTLGRSFGSKIVSWCTFNEPGVYTFSGYCMGSFPPGKHLHFGLAGKVLKHMLIAHTEAYKLIKSMPGARHVSAACESIVLRELGEGAPNIHDVGQQH